VDPDNKAKVMSGKVIKKYPGHGKKKGEGGGTILIQAKKVHNGEGLAARRREFLPGNITTIGETESGLHK